MSRIPASPRALLAVLVSLGLLLLGLERTPAAAQSVGSPCPVAVAPILDKEMIAVINGLHPKTAVPRDHSNARRQILAFLEVRLREQGWLDWAAVDRFVYSTEEPTPSDVAGELLPMDGRPGRYQAVFYHTAFVGPGGEHLGPGVILATAIHELRHGWQERTGRWTIDGGYDKAAEYDAHLFEVEMTAATGAPAAELAVALASIEELYKTPYLDKLFAERIARAKATVDAMKQTGRPCVPIHLPACVDGPPAIDPATFIRGRKASAVDAAASDLGPGSTPQEAFAALGDDSTAGRALADLLANAPIAHPRMSPDLAVAGELGAVLWPTIELANDPQLAEIRFADPPTADTQIGFIEELTAEFPVADRAFLDREHNCDDEPGGPIGRVSGDPHLVTIDGADYDFQGAGDYVLLESVEMTVHTRFAPDTRSDRVSWTTAVAVRTDDVTVEVRFDEPDVLVVDGRPEADGRGSFVAGTTQVDATDSELRIRTESGYGVRIGRGLRGFNVAVSIPEGDVEVQGLLGDADGDPANDLATRDGTIVTVTDENWDDLYDVFGASWRLDAPTSAFTYEPGSGPDDHFRPNFPAGLLSLDQLDPEDRRMAEEACRATGLFMEPFLSSCTIDVAVTGEPALAPEFLAGQHDAIRRLQPAVVGQRTLQSIGRFVLWQATDGSWSVSATFEPLQGHVALTTLTVGEGGAGDTSTRTIDAETADGPVTVDLGESRLRVTVVGPALAVAFEPGDSTRVEGLAVAGDAFDPEHWRLP